MRWIRLDGTLKRLFYAFKAVLKWCCLLHALSTGHAHRICVWFSCFNVDDCQGAISLKEVFATSHVASAGGYGCRPHESEQVDVLGSFKWSMTEKWNVFLDLQRRVIVQHRMAVVNESGVTLQHPVDAIVLQTLQDKCARSQQSLIMLWKLPDLILGGDSSVGGLVDSWKYFSTLR